jgi:serine/threonine-protein kinase
MSQVCKGCGHTNKSSALFCRGCGLPLPESEAADSLIGHEILGTYQLAELLGKGGMSVVYLARHLLTEQEVAVKILPPELASQKELKSRFIEEARALARLEHPNIVLLHNLAEESGHLYLVMQYAEGETFDTVIEREGRVEMGEAVDVGIQVLRALEYAHEQGVIHRDIKPSNIIVRGDGSVKVMDFGLAKFMGSTKLTQTGLTMGTVRYMSPEQVRGKQVDHRSDLYSLGITLYEAITGKTPFDGESHFDIMQQHLSTAPPLPSELVDMPDEMQRALLKALKKKVENRFQTARSFRHAMQALPVEKPSDKRGLSESVPFISGAGEVSEPVEEPGPPPKARRRIVMPIAVAGLLLLLSGVAVVWALLDKGPVNGGHDGGGKLPRGVGKTARATPWPAPHKVARSLTWKVDKTFGPPDRLRVIATKPLDPEALLSTYKKARKSYQSFLMQEGIDLHFKIGPLNLVIVEQALLNDSQLWPDVKPHTDYPTRYLAPEATLYVHNSKGYRVTDLSYGFALHFCARISRLSNQRCLDFAEGFERFFRGQD